MQLAYRALPPARSRSAWRKVKDFSTSPPIVPFPHGTCHRSWGYPWPQASKHTTNLCLPEPQAILALNGHLSLCWGDTPTTNHLTCPSTGVSPHNGQPVPLPGLPGPEATWHTDTCSESPGTPRPTCSSDEANVPPHTTTLSPTPRPLSSLAELAPGDTHQDDGDLQGGRSVTMACNKASAPPQLGLRTPC